MPVGCKARPEFRPPPGGGVAAGDPARVPVVFPAAAWRRRTHSHTWVVAQPSGPARRCPSAVRAPRERSPGGEFLTTSRQLIVWSAAGMPRPHCLRRAPASPRPDTGRKHGDGRTNSGEPPGHRVFSRPSAWSRRAPMVMGMRMSDRGKDLSRLKHRLSSHASAHRSPAHGYGYEFPMRPARSRAG